MKRKLYSSGAPWESRVGYSRAVKTGPFIEVAGTTAVVNGVIVGEDDPYLQTITILNIMEKAVRELGGSLQDVVRTRIFVTNIKHFEEVGRAHGTFFKDIRPASTMVEVSALVDPKMLVEIELSAIIAKENEEL